MTAQQLKNSILQMAVQGKLVPQDPNDEPASVLLERIRAEKEDMVRAGKIKKEKNPSVIFRGEDNQFYEKIGNREPVCIADDVPFEIPESWEWVRLHSLVSKEIKRGKSPKYSEQRGIQVFAQKCNVKSGGIDMKLAKYLDPDVFGKYPQEEYLQEQDIIINSTGNGTLGRIGIFQDTDRIDDSVIVPDSHVTVIRLLSSVDKVYLLYVLKYFQPYLEKQGEGSTNQTELKPIIISNLYIPIPPMDEQKRIEKKLADVLPLIDSYGEKEVMLANYNETFPEQIKKSILQLAVQGKLVPQDSNDEPASVLLERICEEKKQLIREGKIKRDKQESVIYRRDNSYYEKLDGIERCIDDEIPFKIPESWEWVRLQNLCFSIADGDHQPPPKENKGYPFLVISNVSSGKLDFSNTRYVSPRYFEALIDERVPEFGDILFTVTGSYGIPVKVDTSKKFCFQRHMALLKLALEWDYIYYALSSPVIKLQCDNKATGTAQKTVGLAPLRGLLIPLPPLNEQHRIANKLKELLFVAQEL